MKFPTKIPNEFIWKDICWGMHDVIDSTLKSPWVLPLAFRDVASPVRSNLHTSIDLQEYSAMPQWVLQSNLFTSVLPDRFIFIRLTSGQLLSNLCVSHFIFKICTELRSLSRPRWGHKGDTRGLVGFARDLLHFSWSLQLLTFTLLSHSLSVSLVRSSILKNCKYN